MTVWNDAALTQRLIDANWMANLAVLIHLNERATGDPARDWLSAWAHRYFAADRARVLVLGCGEGWLERALAGWPHVEHIDAVDFAADAVARARDAARGIAKIDYGVVDLNRDELRPAAYDVVVAHSVLHHVENLEHAYAQIERTMRPNAFLVLNEYAGPDRFQFDDNVLRIMNALFDCLPARLHHPFETRTRPSVDEVIANDPSEAVRSSELLAFTERSFEVVARKNMGGTLLQHLLYGIAASFRFDAPKERAMIELLCTIEAMLVDAHTIPSDFVLMAARKRGARVAPRPRPLPPRAEGAADIESDPLRFGRAPVLRRDAGRLRPFHLRMLRIALASTHPRRANLYRESALRGAWERFRARGADPWEWIRARHAAASGLADEDDRAIAALLETAARLA